ncbi:MAG TPA: YCF48-related protein, partial [Bacteroidia bacterium]|nr:YCF48-related protein [Bacteroidia bacterium]
MKKIITLSVAAFISLHVFAQWDTLHTNTTSNFNSICFKDENNGVAVGKDPVTSRGIAFYTTDGGLTWLQSLNANNAPSYNDIVYSSLGSGYIAVTDSGSILQSLNGSGFTRTIQLGTENFNAVFLVENTNSIIYIGGDNGVLYRIIGSNLPDTLNSGTTLSINDIYFADAANGWIVGDGGYMAATSDSGQTWTTVTQPYFGFFNCSGFAYAGSTADAFAVGNSGDMIHSSNGGVNWNAFPSNTSYNLNSVRFTNDLAGIVAGYYGVIRRTQDGGITWWDESMPYVTDNLTGISWA